MATYKAEFYAHYYRRRLRPRTAYAMGLIYWWSRLAAWVPTLANGMTQTPGISGIAKRLGNIHPERPLPRYAKQSFRAWFSRRRRRPPGKPVLLWPDTFYNFFYPEVPRAAVAVLENAGYKPLLPPRSVCCGRPLYAWGMLDTARRQLRQTLDTIYPWMAQGIPLVGLEPSCIAVFRDELPNMLADDPRATPVANQSYLFSEFLTESDYQPPQLNQRALIHVHCNQHAVLDADADGRLLTRAGIDCHKLDSGCCGMSGPFGFERAHYDIAQAVGETVLLPAVREAPDDTLIVTNGFSCREQIAHNTRRRAAYRRNSISGLTTARRATCRKRLVKPVGLLPKATSPQAVRGRVEL
ncbi:(Fe-S)-binding protein [Alkalilimnicola ehrlichii]|uniref:(Fe-S)-binding protein n=1 Tax=Alkalilimnicola ehrlichii TaxID=351052 RepID=UPI0021637A37|nr:heterodisulfide reductase-related iron-sulfur binding cluster [Alkalilimnicola ehrlichii]